MYLSIKKCVITEKHLLSKNVTVIACNIFYIRENGTIFNHKNVSFYEYSASYLVSTLLILMYIASFLGEIIITIHRICFMGYRDH
jgi:hypothetical protein